MNFNHNSIFSPESFFCVASFCSGENPQSHSRQFAITKHIYTFGFGVFEHTSVQFDASNSISVSFKGDKLFKKPSSSYPGLYGILAFGRESKNRTDTEKLAISTWNEYALKKH